MDERRLSPFVKVARAKARQRVQRREDAGEAGQIAEGVFHVARDLEGRVRDGSLYWQAPFQYVMEIMAPRVVADKGLDPSQLQAVAEYLMAGVNELVVAMVASFDREHFEAWTAAMQAKAPDDAGSGRLPRSG